MSLLNHIHRFFFAFDSYATGVKRHLVLLLAYSAAFIGFYFFYERLYPDADEFFYHQQRLSRLLLAVMALHLLLVTVFRRKQIALLGREYFSEKGSAFNLAVFRIIFFFMLAGHCFFYSPVKDLPWAGMPDSSRVSLPFMGWLVQHIPITPSLFLGCAIIAGILCFMVCIGFLTRYASVLLLPFVFYIIGIPMFYGKLSHSHILLWVPVFMSFAPSADALSLDAWLRRRKGLDDSLRPRVEYMLSFKLIWLQLAVIYFFAGVVKLWDCGLDWALGENMVNQMRWEWVEQYDRVPSLRLDNYPVIAKAGGLLVIYFELLYVFLIVKPKGRIWAFITAFSFHKICGYFMYIDFENLRMTALSYINWQKLRTVFQKEETAVFSEEANEPIFQFIPSGRISRGFAMGLLLIAINVLFSCFKIHSYPFSSYPTYSAMARDHIDLVRMDAYDSANRKIDLKGLAKQANFRWENIRPYEMRIVEAFERKDSLAVSGKINEYWLIWRNNLKELGKAKRVEVFIESSSIVPEKRKQILRTDTIGVLHF